MTQLVAIDRDPLMLRQARRRLGEASVPVRLIRADGERLPFADAAFDSAIAALVLCTVDDPEGTVAELYRVLRPGGRLLMMEHVRAANETLAHWQDRLQRPWSWVNGGCRPNRATIETIEAAGFRIERLERYGFDVLPHVQCVALRP